MTNKAPPVDNADTFQNCISFQFKNIFKDQYELDTEYKYTSNARLADPSIKVLVEEDRMIRAFTHLIIQSYHTIRQGMPVSMRADHQLFLQDAVDGRKSAETTIPQFVQTSINPNDKKHTCDILMFLKNEALFDCSPRDLHRVLRANGIGEYVESFRLNGRQTSGYKNIKLVPPIAQVELVDDDFEEYDEEKEYDNVDERNKRARFGY